MKLNHRMHLSMASREASWSAVASDSATPLSPKRPMHSCRETIVTAWRSGIALFDSKVSQPDESGVVDAKALPLHLCHRTPRRFATLYILAVEMLVTTAMAQEKPAAAAIDGVTGVKQEAVQSINRIEPPAVNPTTPNTAQTVNNVDGVNTISGVKAPGQAAPPPPPPAPAGNAAQGVNKVEGIKPAPPNAVQAIPPPLAGAVNTIRAVQGVQGIIAPKQLNLEAALLMKEDGKGTPAGGGAEGGKGKAAAAALLSGPPGQVPAPPAPDGDGRAVFEEFEKQTAPGS